MIFFSYIFSMMDDEKQILSLSIYQGKKTRWSRFTSLTITVCVSVYRWLLNFWKIRTKKILLNIEAKVSSYSYWIGCFDFFLFGLSISGISIYLSISCLCWTNIFEMSQDLPVVLCNKSFFMEFFRKKIPFYFQWL